MPQKKALFSNFLKEQSNVRVVLFNKNQPAKHSSNLFVSKRFWMKQPRKIFRNTQEYCKKALKPNNWHLPSLHLTKTAKDIFGKSRQIQCYFRKLQPDNTKNPPGSYDSTPFITNPTAKWNFFSKISALKSGTRYLEHSTSGFILGFFDLNANCF